MNATDGAPFRRLVLDLCTTTPDATALRLAGELARLLRLDLTGLIVEDPALSRLVGLPGMREFRLHGPGWERLDPTRIAAEADQIVARARRLLAELAAATGLPSAFETQRGPIADIIARAAPTDILFLAEPRRPAGPPGEAFLQRYRAAYHSAASVLLVPAARLRSRGPIVTLVGGADDASLPMAARIALRAHEPLVILGSDGHLPASLAEQAVGAGLALPQIHVRALARMDIATLVRLCGEWQPRLLVLTRGSALSEDLDALLRLASQGNVAILAVEPVTDASGR